MLEEIADARLDCSLPPVPLRLAIRRRAALDDVAWKIRHGLDEQADVVAETIDRTLEQEALASSVSPRTGNGG